MRRSAEWIISAPPLLWLILFFLVPTLIVYAFSFKPSELYGGIGSGWTWDTVRALWSQNNGVIITRTLCLSTLATLLSLLIALPVGYAIAQAKGKRRNTLLLLVVLPLWSSFIVRIFAWKTLLHPEGMFKQFLVFLHIVNPDTILLYNSWTVILVMVYSYLPFAILPIYAAAAKFDESLFEAAMDLGMTRLKAFFNVFLPCIRTGIITATLLVFIPALGAYVIPDVVGGTQNEMIGNKIVQKTFIDRNIPLASALSAFLSLAVLIPLGAVTLLQGRTDKYHVVKGGH